MKNGILILMALVVSDISAITLQTLDTYGEGSLRPTDLSIIDEDRNGIVPNVDDRGSYFVLQTNTMPPSYVKDPNQFRENNYVYLPFVPRPSHGYVDLELKYRHLKECPKYPNPAIQCRDYIDLYVVGMRSKQRNVPPADLKQESTRTIRLSLNESIVDVSNYIPDYYDGIQVVLHDEGSAFEISSLDLTTFDFTTTTRRYFRSSTWKWDYGTVQVSSASQVFGNWAILSACLMAAGY